MRFGVDHCWLRSIRGEPAYPKCVTLIPTYCAQRSSTGSSAPRCARFAGRSSSHSCRGYSATIWARYPVRRVPPKSWSCWHLVSRSFRYTWWRYAEPAAGITWSNRMCSARPARPARRALHGGRAARGRRATAPARPVNNEGHQDRSASRDPNGAGADGGPQRSSGLTGGGPRHTPRARARSGPVKRPAVPPDDRLTAILPPVRDDESDPIEVVKAALEGRPPTRGSAGRDSLDLATAALEIRPPGRRRPPPEGPPPSGRPPGPRSPKGPDREPTHRIDWARLGDIVTHINWKWVRRGFYVAIPVLFLLPIVTFVMAYFIV